MTDWLDDPQELRRRLHLVGGNAAELARTYDVPVDRIKRRRAKLTPALERGEYERVLFLSDVHAPFHDVRVWDQVVAFAADFNPHRVVWNGDILDAYSISRFSKDPERKFNLQDELDATRELLRQMRGATPLAAHDFVPGNHEIRLEKYLWDRAPEIASLQCLRLGELLGLSELGITLHGPSGFKLRPKFRVTHGSLVRKHAGHSAKAEFEKYGISGISGHTHRAGEYSVTNDGGTYSWTEQGCLCKLDAEYIQGVANWQQSFAVGEFEWEGNNFRLELVRVISGELIYHGRSYAPQQVAA